ncbi:MAG: hypothetical protein J6Y91_06365 [Alphaproteobacteria bacterium]|nr:hypothetical protein [Alphaproteobacteria bacterium]
MEEKDIDEAIKTILFQCIDFVLSVLFALGVVALIELHFIVPLFPILFLFDLCLIVGYPLFLRYVLKKKWFECCKDKLLQIKYILLPILFLEILTLFVVIVCYPNEILQAS